MDFARCDLFPLYSILVVVVVVSPCKFVGIRGLDKTTAPLFLPPFFSSVEGLATRECRIVGNSVQLGHSQLGTLTPARARHSFPYLILQLSGSTTRRDLRQVAFAKSSRKYRRNLVTLAYPVGYFCTVHFLRRYLAT